MKQWTGSKLGKKYVNAVCCHPAYSSLVKTLPANAVDVGSIPGLGQPLGEGNGNPLQYFCLENPRDRGTWWASVHGVVKDSDTT